MMKFSLLACGLQFAVIDVGMLLEGVGHLYPARSFTAAVFQPPHDLGNVVGANLGIERLARQMPQMLGLPWRGGPCCPPACPPAGGGQKVPTSRAVPQAEGCPVSENAPLPGMGVFSQQQVQRM
jgi:hypothetical protein